MTRQTGAEPVRKKLGATLVILLFAMPFGAVGAIASWAIAHMVRSSFAASDWVLVQARVSLAELSSSTSKKSTSYQAVGVYHYPFNGKLYESSQLAFDLAGATDNIGDWQQEMGAFLTDAKATGKTIPVFVNPDNPGQAVVDRDVRWGMVAFMSIFAVLFGGVGLGGLYGAFRVWRSGGLAGGHAAEADSVRAYVARRDAAAAPSSQQDMAERPNPPSIEPEGRGSMGVGWFFTILWNAISWPVAYFVTVQVIAKGEWLAAFVYLFPLFGLLMLWGILSTTVSQARRGKSALVLHTPSPAMGERVAGAITFEKQRASGIPFELELGAFDVKGRNEGSPSVIPRWSAKQAVRLADDPRGGSRVTFSFDIPPRVDHAALGTEWRLLLKNPGAFGVLETYPFTVAPLRQEDDTFAAKRDPDLGRHERASAAIFGAQAAARMTPGQQATVANLSPEGRALVANLHKHGKTIRNGVYAIIGLIIASQVIPGIMQLIRTD